MIGSHYRSLNVGLSQQRDRDLLACLGAMGLAGKNIANTTTFLIKQVLSSYRWQGADVQLAYVRSATLHAFQQQVLDFLNTQIDQYNQEKAAKRNAKITAQAAKLSALPPEEALKVKAIALFAPVSRFDVAITKDVHNQIFDGKFLYYVVQQWNAQQAVINNVSVPDTQALPGAIAQNVVFDIRDDFINYFKAVKAYGINPSGFTGRPKEPGYLGKNSRKTLQVDMAQLHGKLIVTRRPAYFLDYARTKPLPAVSLAAYQAVDVNAWIEALRVKHQLHAGAAPEQLRIVCSGRLPKLEIVFSIPVEIAATSLIGQLDQMARDANWYSKATPDFAAVLARRGAAMQSRAQQLCREQNLVMAGGDLGMTNLITIGYHATSPVRGGIVTGKQYKKRIQGFDKELDALKATLTPEAVKAIQRRQEAGEPISKADRDLLRHAYQSLYAAPAYAEALAHKSAFVQDTVHKLSRWVVDELVARKVQLLVIGKNPGWKQEANLGRIKNREFHNFPHARFIEVLRYKAFEHGILVLETEEAFTSQSSFINNGILPAYEDRHTALAQANAMTPTASPSEAPRLRLRDLLGGMRGAGHKRHRYTSTLPSKKITLHADLNAALNILRKVCTWLCFDPLRHHLRASIVGLCWSGFGGRRKEHVALICR